MEREIEYNDAISIVSDVEGSGQGNRIVILRMKEILADRVNIRWYDEQEARLAIDNAASIVPYSQAEETARPAAKKAGNIGKKVGEIVKDIESVAVAPVRQAVGRSAADMLEKDAGNAAKELRSLISGRARKNAPAEAARQSNDEMVMPSLSLPDQIAELDRIAMGLDSNIFNNEQLKLIRLEVTALMGSSKSEKRDEKIDMGLVSLRDQKLKSVGSRLASREG